MVLWWLQDTDVKYVREFESGELETVISDVIAELGYDEDSLESQRIVHGLHYLNCYIGDEGTIMITDYQPQPQQPQQPTGNGGMVTVGLGEDGNFEMHGNPGPGVQVLEGEEIDQLVNDIQQMCGTSEDDEDDNAKRDDFADALEEMEKDE